MIETPSFRLPEGPAIWHDPATCAWYFWGEGGGITMITDYLAQTEPDVLADALSHWFDAVCAKRHLKMRPEQNVCLESEVVRAALKEERLTREYEAWCRESATAEARNAAREDNRRRFLEMLAYPRQEAVRALFDWHGAEEKKQEITSRRQAEGLR